MVNHEPVTSPPGGASPRRVRVVADHARCVWVPGGDHYRPPRPLAGDVASRPCGGGSRAAGNVGEALPDGEDAGRDSVVVRATMPLPRGLNTDAVRRPNF